jgi:hypothetical protein
MKRNRILILLLAFIVLITCCGVTYSSWTMTSIQDTDEKSISPVVTSWNFVPDSAIFENVKEVTNLNYERETTILSLDTGDTEAVRFTNTASTQSKSHSFVMALDRDYTVGEVQNYKIEFDYYHSKKNKDGNTYPQVQLFYNGSSRGNKLGGGTYNEFSPYVVTEIDDDWWHLEYFVSALCPTMADHGDSGIPKTYKINRVKIFDDSIKDINSTTVSFVVLDNLRFHSSQSSRLGLFNKTAEITISSKPYFWLKVCWAGELKSVNFTFSDDTLAEYTPSANSPFYFKGLKPGKVIVTAILTIGDNNQVLTISKEVTIKA